MQTHTDAEIARIERAREDLAKEWLLGIIARTPLTQVEEVPVAWIAREAPPLITEILRGIADPSVSPDLTSAAQVREHAGQLGRLRQTDAAPAQIPRDLASLQSLLVAALRREIPEYEGGRFARAVERLAEIFGGIQGTVAEAIVRERSGDARRDELTGLPGPAHLHEWLRLLVANHERYGHPFGLAWIDIDGLQRVNEAYGRDAGDRMLAAVADVVARQIRAGDRLFRMGDDELCALAPHHTAEQVQPLAQRLRRMVEASQADVAPRVSISVGLASCPADGETPERLLEAVQEATYAAKASGEGIAVGKQGPGRRHPLDFLQNP